MEEKGKKYSHQDTKYYLNYNQSIRLEDPTTLKLQQYKLIIEKKELMKYSKMQKLPHSDNLRHINHWDLVLNQTKFLAIDFNEERKWKNSISYIMANKIAAKIKRKKSNKKIDDLYQECLCIYFSININSTVTDITLPNDNKNKNDQLNQFLKKNNNLEYLSNEFVKWKGSINQLKARLTKKFGEKNINKAEKFLKVLNLIENIIAIQEDTVKRLNTTKIHEEEMNNDKDQVILSDFAIVFESCSNTLYQDHHMCSEYAESSNLDYNKLNNEITMLIDNITNEINEATNDAMIISNDQFTAVDSFNQSDLNNELPTIDLFALKGANGVISTYDTFPNTVKPNYRNVFKKYNQSNDNLDDAILSSLNPNKLFFSIQDFSLSTKDIKIYFEKLFKTDKFDILPRYNYKKMLGNTFDINTPEYDFENVFFRVFPPIYYNDSSFKNKTLLDKEIDTYQFRSKKKKTQKDIEAVSQYNSITPLQKITYIWAMSLYGTNFYIINAINNISEFSHNVKLGNEEINYIIENILDEIGIDMFGSNLNLLTHCNYSQISNLIEPSIQIGATSNFNYNAQLSDYIKGNISTLKTDKGIKEKYSLPTYSFGSVLRNSKDYYCPLSFMNKNPLYKNAEKKKKLYQDLKRQLIKFCDKIETLNTKCISKYDYFNMTKLEINHKAITVTQMSNEINSVLSYTMNNGDKNNKMTKENLLKQFNNSSNMSIKAQTEKVLDSTQLKLHELLNVISFYSKDEIESEWKAMRTPWYQNNTEFRPKPKKPQIPNTGNFPVVNVRQSIYPNQYHSNSVTISTSSNSTGHYSNYF